MRIARYALAVLLAAIAAFLAFAAAVAIAKVFDEYKDSPDAVYIGVGGTALAISALFAAAAALTLAPGRHPQGWLALTLVTVVASALPYAEAVGNTGYIVNGVLALLAIASAVTHLRTAPRA